MRVLTRHLAVFPLIVLAALTAQPARCQDPSLLVSDLLAQIQRGINKAKATIDEKYKNVPPLESVTLQLQTETQNTGTAGINLWFVKIGGGGGKTSSSQMTLVLKPSTTKNPVSNQQLDETIYQVLVGAAKGVFDAQTGQNGIPLLLDALTADFAFTVNKKVDGGVEFKLLPIGGSGDIAHAKTDTHKITVKFAKPHPAKS